jgi:hypothetical protein
VVQHCDQTSGGLKLLQFKIELYLFFVESQQ